MALAAQAFGKIAEALAGPEQWRLRVAARRRFDQRAQIVEQAGIGLGRRLVASARPADTVRIGRLAAAQFGESPSNRAAGDARRSPHRHDPAASRGTSLRPRKEPPPSLVE